MFQSVARSAPRRLLSSSLPPKFPRTRRFLTTAPPSQKSRTWKSSAARWALAIGGVYYYNTSTIFAEQTEGSPTEIDVLNGTDHFNFIEAISRLDQSLHHFQESKLPTLDSIIEEKRQRLSEQHAQASSAVPDALDSEEDDEEPGGIEDLEEEADQQGAFNPETGEINWDCPCLGGMAHGPCGEEFKAAFSCFVYSKEEPKGIECIDKFKGMQDCFREHPDMYGSELEDDEDEMEDELKAEASQRSSDASKDPMQSSQIVSQDAPKPAIGGTKDHVQPIKAGDEGGQLVPKAAHDSMSK